MILELMRFFGNLGTDLRYDIKLRLLLVIFLWKKRKCFAIIAGAR